MCLLGCDIGSSSIKVSIVDEETGLTIGADFYPKEEAPIKALRPGWAEQNPEDWWSYVKIAMKGAMSKAKVKGEDIKAIGISYQMHGLVVVDKKMEVLRPSIIWCDSRAVPYGERAFKNIGEKRCLSHLLNSPGNFTASKLAWIKEYEPDIYDRIHKIMLPGDFIAMRLTGDIVTTVSGLSEGIFWDFKNNALSEDLMNYYGFSKDLIADRMKPNFMETERTLERSFQDVSAGIRSETFASLKAVQDTLNQSLTRNDEQISSVNKRFEELSRSIREEIAESGKVVQSTLNQSLIRSDEQIKSLNEIAKRRGQTLAQMALSWILKDETVASVLIGASRPQQRNFFQSESRPRYAESVAHPQ